MKTTRLRRPPITALPSLLWFALFLIIPVCIVVLYSFAQKGTYGGIVYEWTADNFRRSFDPVYLHIFWNSVKLAALTTLSCLLLGYPMAYAMATAPPRWQKALLVLVVVPFWTNFVVRAYALKIMLPGSQGDRMVWYGMVTNYLPFMVLPLYTSLEKFDFSLLEAARDLGASSFNVVRRVLIPQTLPGIITGCVFVFTPALGEFVIPDLLGGARTMLAGNLITEQFLKTRDWPFGSALSLILIVIVLVTLLLYLKYGQEPTPGMEGEA